MKKIFIPIILALSSLFFSCQDNDELIERIEIESLGDSLYTGQQYHLKLLYFPREPKDARISWVVSDPHLASVFYGGLLKPQKKGVISVTANLLLPDGRKTKAMITLNIFSSGVYLNDKSIVLNPLESKELTYQFLPKDYIPSEKLTWTSSNEEFVSVDQGGSVIGLAEGSATVKVRLGNPLSDFFSEDSCLVTVQNFREPIYSYNNAILLFEQEVPGLLPSIASAMPEFKEIKVKGPINGSDLLFFIENSNRIERIDLSETRVYKGGRTYRKANPKQKNKWDVFATENDSIPETFFTDMKISYLTVPPFLKSTFGFGKNFLIEYLAFPDSYQDIKIKSCNVNELKLPNNLKSLTCYMGETPKSGGPYKAANCIFNKKLSLPPSLKIIDCAGTFKEELEVPKGIEQVLLGDSIEVLKFNSLTKLKNSNLPLFYYRQQLHFYIKKLILPQDLEVIKEGFLYQQQQLNYKPHTSISVDTIVFPSSLKRIEAAAFAYCLIKGPIKLAEGLKKIGQQAFLRSSVKELVLPASLESIGTQAFAMCAELEKVYCHAVKPPKLGELAFIRNEKMGRMHQLIVPEGAKEQYVTAGYAPYFFEIIEKQIQ